MISFDHAGTAITNPFLSECGRFEIEPAEYGFVAQDTDCDTWALVKALDNGEQLRLTTADGRSAPLTADGAWIERIDLSASPAVIERHPVPLPGTVATYAQALLHMHDLDLDPEVQRLKVDTGCGEECVKVLDAASELVAVAREVADEVRTAVERQLRIFYFG